MAQKTWDYDGTMEDPCPAQCGRHWITPTVHAQTTRAQNLRANKFASATPLTPPLLHCTTRYYAGKFKHRKHKPDIQGFVNPHETDIPQSIRRGGKKPAPFRAHKRSYRLPRRPPPLELPQAGSKRHR